MMPIAGCPDMLAVQRTRAAGQPRQRQLLELAKLEILERLPDAANELHQVMIRALHLLRVRYSIERGPHVDRGHLEQCAAVRSGPVLDPGDAHTPIRVVPGRALEPLRHPDHEGTRIGADGRPPGEDQRYTKPESSGRSTHGPGV